MDELELQRLGIFIEQSECRINAILTKLGWTKENLLQSELKPSLSEKKHVNEKLCHEDMFPQTFLPVDCPYSIQMDNVKQAEVILEGLYQNPSFELGVVLEDVCARKPPTNIEELQVNFTREERLLLYEHAIKNTSKPRDVPDIKIRFKQDSHSAEKHASWPEIAAMERDARRRNPKHRVAKNPLTYSEELRRLIHIQTEALTQHLRQETAAKHLASTSNKSKRRRRSRSRSLTDKRGHGENKRSKKRSRSKDRTQERHYVSPERKHHKSRKKHKKKHDR